MVAQGQAAPIPTILSTWRWGNLASVAGAAVNNFIIPTGDNVHGIMLYCRVAVGVPLTRAQLITDIATVRLFLNGDLIFDRTATQLLDEYLFHFGKFGAMAAPLGVLPISCMNHNLPIFDQRRGAALGMLKSNGVAGQGPYNTLSCEVTMTAAPAAILACEVHVVTDLYPQEPTGMHIRRLRTTRDLMAIGDNLIQDLPRSGYGLLSMTVINAAVIGHIDVMADSRYIYRDLEFNTLQVMMDEAGRTPVATYNVIPFDLGNDLHSNLPYAGLSKLVVNVQTTAAAPGAGTVILIEEVWDSVRE
jgi:hypothetical protein